MSKSLINGISAGHTKDNSFNGMSCLAAALVAHFKQDIGGVYLYPPSSRDMWEEYTYFIDGETGGRPTITVIDYAGHQIFTGPAEEYMVWVANWED